MMIESLEHRQLLSAATSVNQVGSVVFISANKPDTINVVENAGSVHVETGNATNQYDFVGVTAININGSSKADTIFYGGNSIGANINGNDGNDNISVDDEGTGSSTANGNGGADSITVVHGNNTIVNGNEGNDQIYANTDGSSTSSTIVDAGGGADNVTVYGGTLFANGGAGKDTLFDASGGTAVISSANFETFMSF
jgi:Ca2+-binding RTX toxin-like protein